MARHIHTEQQNVRNHQWQQTVGTQIARYAKAFEMKVIAWSENLTEEKGHRAGAELVTKERLFRIADFVTLHLVLGQRTKGIMGDKELHSMKPTSYLINTSRGPLVDEAALIKALQEKTIAGAALDVFDTEPLPYKHPLRNLPNVLATPHIGYVTEDTYRVFYGDTVRVIEAWMAEQAPTRYPQV
jgi:phosphoglycerate dehydrogenase-like enzyme